MGICKIHVQQSHGRIGVRLKPGASVVVGSGFEAQSSAGKKKKENQLLRRITDSYSR